MPLLCSDFGFDPLGLLDPVNSGGFINPQWLQYSEVITPRMPLSAANSGLCAWTE